MFNSTVRATVFGAGERMTEDLPRRVKYWLTEAKPDCFFVVGPENGSTEKIGAMKTLLMGDSEPLRAMLQDSEMAEKGDIRVTDVDPETFRNFLICVYGGSNIIIPKLTFEESAKLFYVIEKYLVNDIKTEITNHLKNLFSFEYIFVALSHPICYQAGNSLKKEMLEILRFDFEKITKDDKFLELTYTVIEWILQVQYLAVKEIEIWNAVLRWAKHKTDSSDGNILYSYIFDLLKYIRFLTMDHNEFWDSVVSSEILLDEEINDICKAFVSGKPCNIEHLCSNRRNRYNNRPVSKNIISSFIDYPRYAFIRCSVSSVSDLTTFNQYSKTYHWAGYLWQLIVRKVREGEKDTLGVWVECVDITSNWNCEVGACIQLINQTGKSDISGSFSHTFDFSDLDQNWGWPSFYEWNALLNPDNGFVKDNNIIVVAKLYLKKMTMLSFSNNYSFQ